LNNNFTLSLLSHSQLTVQINPIHVKNSITIVQVSLRQKCEYCLNVLFWYNCAFDFVKTAQNLCQILFTNIAKNQWRI